MAGKYDGTLKYDTQISTEGFKKGLDGLKSIAKSSFAAIGAAGVAAAGAFVSISKAAIGSFAEYEQLAGGVETLFKDSANTVKKYADEAYKTAGLSANEYMETVTGFSASLLQSLGGDTAKAAEYGNQAVVDMSDNANKMGTSMESIQNAYQGFAKQNYTMLDNLKLGYGGTKEEMERLLEDAGKISGIDYDISSFADITEAIHVVQTELGITGTTALEAEQTISGSANMMKSSWENMLTGFADPSQDIGVLLEKFVSSVSTFAANLMPVIENSANSIIQVLPSVLDQAVALINEMLPSVITAVMGIIGGIVEVLPELITALAEFLPQIVTEILNLLPDIIQAGLDIVLALATGIAKSLPELIPTIVDVILQICQTLIDNLDQLLFAAIDIIVALATGLIDALPNLLERLPEIITALVMALTDPTMLLKLIEAAILLMAALTEGLIKSIPAILIGVAEIVPAMIDGFKSYYENFKQIGKHLIDGLWQGILNTKDWLVNHIKKWCGVVVDGIKSFFGIHSPSTLFRDEIGKMMVAGMGEGITENKGIVTDALSDAYNDMSKVTPKSIECENALELLRGTFGSIPEEYYSLGQSSGEGFVNGFMEKLPNLITSIRSVLQQSVSYISGGMQSPILVGSAAGNTSNTYNTTYNFNTSKDTTTQQLSAARNASALERLRGGAS